MPDTIPELPASSVPGLIPTLNNTGWMTVTLDRLSRDFVDHAGSLAGEVLDIGCAYGVATLAALEQGARVLAADLDARHLGILVGRTPEAHRQRLRTQVASLPGVDFAPGSFTAILAARVLHFLAPPDVKLALYKMFQWLEPGGRLYVVCDSPYVGPWRDAAPEYERRKAQGCPWPGLVIDYHRYLPEKLRATSPAFMHPMDPDVLRRVCGELGFELLRAGSRAEPGRAVPGTTRASWRSGPADRRTGALCRPPRQHRSAALSGGGAAGQGHRGPLQDLRGDGSSGRSSTSQHQEVMIAMFTIRSLTPLILTGALLSLAGGAVVAAPGGDARLDRQGFAAFVDMRAGVGEPVYWYCIGTMKEYPSGRVLARFEGIDTARRVNDPRNPDTAYQLSRKIFVFRDPDTNAVIREYEGRRIPPVAYPYQYISYSLRDGVLETLVEQGREPRVQRIGPVGGLSVRRLGEAWVFTAPLFLDFPVGGGARYQAFENYDFFIQPRGAANPVPNQLSWIRFGSLEPFAAAGQSVQHLVAWRVERYEDLPATIREYIDAEAPLWKAPPRDLDEIRELQRPPG